VSSKEKPKYGRYTEFVLGFLVSVARKYGGRFACRPDERHNAWLKVSCMPMSSLGSKQPKQATRLCPPAPARYNSKSAASEPPHANGPSFFRLPMTGHPTFAHRGNKSCLLHLKALPKPQPTARRLARCVPVEVLP